MDNSQVYLSLVRPTMIPIVGECAAALPFTGQIELAGWSWNMLNLEEARRAKNLAKPYTEKASQIDAQEDAKASGDLQKQLLRTTAKHDKDKAWDTLQSQMKKKRPLDPAAQGEFDDALKSFLSADKDRDDGLKKLHEDLHETLNPKQLSDKDKERKRQKEDLEGQIEDANENKNYQFTFSKRVDIATTQMLNSMKSGDVFPTGVLTIHQASANAGLSLVITVQKLRLIDYQLKVEVSDTMTDMREEWTAEFASLAYVYKNRKAISKSSEVGQAVAKAASQGTVRAFAMKNLGSPI